MTDAAVLALAEALCGCNGAKLRDASPHTNLLERSYFYLKSSILSSKVFKQRKNYSIYKYLCFSYDLFIFPSIWQL